MSFTSLVLICGTASLSWAYIQYNIIAETKLLVPESINKKDSFTQRQQKLLKEVHDAIGCGAVAFLQSQYNTCGNFCVAFALVIFILISWSQTYGLAFLTMLSFLIGALASVVSGFIGMKVAVFSNVRTTINAQNEGFKDAFNTAFRAGSVMGFALVGLGLLTLYFTLLLYSMFFNEDHWTVMMDCISGFGLGGSTVAMFGRVGGGIYTKAAGAKLVGKIIHGIPEGSPRNPATIADNVGDNVGDVAGMGADLFGSFAESTCAALVIAAQTPSLRKAGWTAVCFPLAVTASGIIVSLLSSFVATHLYPVVTENLIERALRLQLIITTFALVPVSYIVAHWYLPAVFNIEGVARTHDANPNYAAFCVSAGAVGGLAIGLSTEYFTSKEFTPVKELVHACQTGAATNIIYGLSLGYKSVVAPVFILALVIYISFDFLDLYGVALAAVGMLGNLATCLTVDAYGPVCDNAGGLAEMAELHPEIRAKTDALDAAGNTTSAIGKGFAIGSASLVSLALYGAFVVKVRESTFCLEGNVEILKPISISFLLIGSMLPYWFSAMTMKSVGEAAIEMVREVQRQFEATPQLLDPDTLLRPDYEACVNISTQAALREMVAPAALVLLAPIIAGTFFGVQAVYGLLTGALLSSVQLAISMSNTGGAWDNCKKLIEASGGKGSDLHKAAALASRCGNPLKDTSGPALNILVKLMAIISLVFADYFVSINNGQGLLKLS